MLAVFLGKNKILTSDAQGTDLIICLLVLFSK